MDQDPKSWGPAAWTFLHWVAARMDQQHEPERMYLFLRILTRYLPCAKCRRHLKENIPRIPMDPLSASRTVYQLHNLVNHQTGKDDFTCYSRVRKHYQAMAREDPPLKIWPFLYAVATYCDTVKKSGAPFWKHIASLLPAHWEFSLPYTPEETMVKQLHMYHKRRDPAALSLQHYILKCQSGC